MKKHQYKIIIKDKTDLSTKNKDAGKLDRFNGQRKMRNCSYGWSFWDNQGVLDLCINRLQSALQNIKTNQSFHFGIGLKSKNVCFGAFRELLKRFTLLQKLSAVLAVQLSFLYSNRQVLVEKKGLHDLSRGLRQAKYLKQLVLNFGRWTEIRDIEIYELSKALKGLTHLRRIGLNFRGCVKISDQGLLKLGQGWKRLYYLEVINLYFDE